MDNVISLADYKKSKKSKKKKKEESVTVPQRSYHYTGKLADALKKYGSESGNVMKEQHKKKEKLNKED